MKLINSQYTHGYKNVDTKRYTLLEGAQFYQLLKPATKRISISESNSGQQCTLEKG